MSEPSARPGQIGSLETGAKAIVAQTVVTFLSTLAIQATTFAVLAIAGLMMPTGAFARLSLVVASTMLASAFFDLGLNLTSTKMFGDTGDEGQLRAAFGVRWMCIPVALLLGVATALSAGAADIGLGVALGAVLNLWNGVRAADQARQDYRSFVRSSVAFAFVRLLAGLAALLSTLDPVITAIATYVVPVATTALSDSARYAFKPFSGSTPPLRPILRYATHVYLSALTFIAIPYVPQFVIASRFDAVAVGTYGLILTFVSPISLAVYSLRSVLLPKLVGSGPGVEDAMWSWRGLAMIAAGLTVMLIGGLLVSLGLDALYGEKFPGIRLAFVLFFSGFALTAMIGLYSLSVHTQGIPQISMLVSVGKFLILVPLLLVVDWTFHSTIVLTALVMVTGEVILVALVGLRRVRLRGAVG